MSTGRPDSPSPSNRELLERIMLATVDIPSLPPVARKVLQTIGDDRSSMTDLEELIYRDHSFAARLLRIANSSFYGRRQTVNTIAEAVLLVGYKTLRSLILGASMRDLHRRFGAVEQQLWQHSLGVSIASSRIARETGGVHPEEALVAGLVHDVGKTVLNNSIADYYVRIVENAAKSGKASTEAEREALGFTHCDAGGYLTRKWLFPENLVFAIEHHHTESLPDSRESPDSRLCRIVSLADSLCLRLAIGTARDAPFSVSALEDLGMTEEGLLSLGDDVRSAHAEHAARSDD